MERKMFLPFTAEDLENAIAQGRVTRRKHDTFPYQILNYSPEVQYSRTWDEVTLNCRGLILDEDYNIVARPWKKFFNLGDVVLPMSWGDKVEVTDKVDGSLGIMYPAPNGANFIATRGSFHSEQAEFASVLLWNKYHEIARMDKDYNDLYTFLFEIVYPGNRIVLDYGDTEDLVLLGAVHNEDGYYFGPQFAKSMLEWPGPVAETFEFDTLNDIAAHMGRRNAEGFVIRHHNFLVKAKEPEYVEVHKLVTNASPKTVWDQLRQGKSKSEIVSAFPDEFHSYIESMIDPLMERFNERVDEILRGYRDATLNVSDAHSGGAFDTPSRKQYAQEFAKHPDKRYFFLLLDNKPIKEVLWTELRPREILHVASAG
jgi:RNA ligase